MLKARNNFPTVIYDNNISNSASNTVDNNEEYKEPGRSDRVAKIMARYYTKIDEITQADIAKHEGLAKKQTEANTWENTEQLNYIDSQEQMNTESCNPNKEQPDMQKRLDIIHESRQKVKQISNSFIRTDDDMKKLEREGQILSIVRKNLDTMARKYWGY